jgi:hypothetical protein
MTLAARIAERAIPDGWERVRGASAAWYRADGATIAQDTYQPTWTATRRRSPASGEIEARSFYTAAAALAWIGEARDARFPARDLTGAVLS